MVDVRETGVCGRGAAGADRGDVQDRLRLDVRDAQKVRQLAAEEGDMDPAGIRRVGILGALTLYLDFVNLFLHILRFLGRKRQTKPFAEFAGG